MKNFTHVVLLCSLLLVALLPAHANSITPAKQAAEEGEGIAFIKDKTFDELLAMAKAEGKLLFVDCFTTWCGPCKWLDANVFNQAEVGEYFDEHFLAAKFDMEKGEGLELAKRYGIQAYPTMIFVNGDGELQHRICGSSPVEQFMDRVAGALDEENRLGTLMARYDSGDRAPAFLGTYLQTKADGCMEPTDNELTAYWNSQDEADLVSEQNWSMMSSFVTKPDEPRFVYLQQHEADFIDAHGQEAVYFYQVDVLIRYVNKALVNGVSAEKLASDELVVAAGQSGRAALAYSQLFIGMRAANEAMAYEGLTAMSEPKLQAYLSPNRLFTVIHLANDGFTNPDYCLAAANYLAGKLPLYEKMDNWKYWAHHYVASLYSRAGEVEKAKHYARLAIDVAKQFELEYTETQKLLDR